MSRLTVTALLLIAIASMAAGCGPGGGSISPTPSQFAAPTSRGPDTPVDTPPPPSLNVSDIPAAITEAVIEEAARVSGVSVDAISVVRAEAVVWHDGSFGCPKPDEMYTQALVNGYWVVVAAGGQEYDFRVGNNGILKLCATDSGG